MNEWEGTPWAGSAVALPAPVEQVETSRALVAKAATGPFLARLESNPYLAAATRTPQEMMRRAQAAYHRHPWVGSAESVVTRRVAGLPWHLEDENDEDYEEPYPGAVQVAHDLLEKPQAQLPPELRDPGMLTRRALISITSRHMGLCGLAYWYLDQPDKFGVPLAILYVNPARVWPATTDKGRVVGWILDPADDTGRGGTPLSLSELLPFYLEPPDRGPYPSGFYERVLLKSQITTLADQHAAYVLGTGGRIPGIVSPKEGTIPQEQYETLVREFRNVNEAPDAAKRTTVVKGPIDFHETASSPDNLDLLGLAQMNRDDIFAVWQVPPSQGAIQIKAGMNSGETKGFDEAILMQGAVHDRVVAIRETIQFGLLDRWLAAGVTIDLEIEEPEFDDLSPAFDRAQKAQFLPLRNKERRELVGLEPFGDDRDEEVWLPATVVLAYGAGQTASEPPAEPTPPAIPNGLVPPAVMPMEQPPITSKSARSPFLGLRRSVDTRWVPTVRSAVAKVLAAQKAEAAAKVRAATPDQLARQHRNRQYAFDRDKETARLVAALRPVVAGIAEVVGTRTTELLQKGDGKAIGFVDRLIARLLKRAGERIAGITATTQDAIANAIVAGFADGLSPAQIADTIEALPAFDEARAEMVARTETAFAYNAAALESYQEYGVNEVVAIDGDDDPECADRDGQTFSVEDALAITDHPNGTLDWSPVFGG